MSRYDFEYEDEDDDESGDIGIENKYYNAKQIKADNPEEAIEEFLGIPALEQDKGDWLVSFRTISFTCDEYVLTRCYLQRGFKGLKQAIKVEFKLSRYEDVSYEPLQ